MHSIKINVIFAVNNCNMKLEIKSGLRFGKLTTVKEAPRRRLPSGQINRFYLCKCDCGNEKEIRLLHLVRNRITSCGCNSRTRNGKGNLLLTKVWRQMKSRCSEKEKSELNKRNYFDRGIRVSEEFMDFDFFYEWSIKNGYKEGLQIDRIDNDKNYSPDNCRWVTNRVNCNNKSDTFYVMYNNAKEPLSLLLFEQGRLNDYPTIRGRIKRGWNAQKAIDTPIRKGNYKRKSPITNNK